MGIFDWLSPAKVQNNPSTYKFTPAAKTVALWLTLALLLLFLFFTAHILPVFIWAAVTAYLFNPMITFFSERTRSRRFFWILALYAILGLLIFFVVKGVIPIASNEMNELASGSPNDPTTFIGKLNSHGEISIFDLKIDIRAQVQTLAGWFRDQLPTQVIPLFFGAVERIVFVVIYFLITFYFLLESGKYFKSFSKLLPNTIRPEIVGLVERINSTLGAYIRAQVVLIVIMSSASFVVLSILRIKYALLLSLATGTLEVIPIVGPVCATMIVTIVALFQATTPFGISHILLAALVVISYFVLRQMEDYFIIPNVASKFVHVHPVLGIFALVVGGSIGGVLGLFLAIPTAAIIKVLLGYLYQKLTEE